MESVGSFEAKTHLPQLLQRVADGEEITITKHGKPVARLVPPLAAKPAPDVRAAVAAMKQFRKGRSARPERPRNDRRRTAFLKEERHGCDRGVRPRWIGDDGVGLRRRSRRVRRGDPRPDARAASLCSALWHLEVANALVVGEAATARRRRTPPVSWPSSARSPSPSMTRHSRGPGWTRCTWPVPTTFPPTTPLIWSCVRRGLPLATLDDRLKAAAAAVGVPLFEIQ